MWTAALDVTNTPATRRVVDQAFDQLGWIDVIVSNAGYGLLGAAEEATDEQLLRQVDTILIGGIQLARATIPHLRAQGGGRIVQISSSGGQVPDPSMSFYNASKFGLEGFYESVAMELAPFGIEVTLVEPGQPHQLQPRAGARQAHRRIPRRDRRTDPQLARRRPQSGVRAQRGKGRPRPRSPKP